MRVTAPQSGPREKLSGSVEHVVFHSPESGFCVLRVRVKGQRELVPVVGTAAVVSPGEFVDSEGWWVNDRSHGLQFKAAKLRIVPPSTLEGIEKYLGSGMVKGIGPHFAKKLVRAFGDQVFEIIENQPDRLTELPGIGPKRKERVTAAWAEQRAVRDIMVFLQAHGVGTARAVRIYKAYGDDAVAKVRENPYRMALEIHGIGFQSADQIARSIGIPADSPHRLRAGVRHALQELASQGHCAARRKNLVAVAAELLDAATDNIDAAIELELNDEHLIAEAAKDTSHGEQIVYLAPLFMAERGVAFHLRRIAEGAPQWGAIDTNSAITWAEKRTGTVLSASQRDAVAMAVAQKLSVITGGPGVGKTTVVNTILQIVCAKQGKVLCAAPTGRAAKRLAESTGMPATTIHRLLEFDPTSFGFKHDADDPLEGDLLVIDETSMVDIVLMNQLLRAVGRQTAVLLVGDVDQLPSVGPGAVLSDVIASGVVPTTRLTEIFRQAGESRIIVNAHRINDGELPLPSIPGEELSDFYFIPADDPEEIHHKLMQVVTERIPRRFGFDPIRDTQVLSPANRAGLGSRALNVELQQRLNGEATPRVTRFGWTYAPGDKVLQTINNYDKETFNGDVGTVVSVDLEDQLLLTEFDGREVRYEFGELDELSLAYAMTVHKSQGSEYSAVVIPLATQHYTLLERNLLYTAVTRGKRLVVIIGQTRALAMAVKNRRAEKRVTRLAERLNHPAPAGSVDS